MPTHLTPPSSICLLRLSALGDVTHVVPLVRTLRAAWPGVPLTWIIGKGEHRLLAGLEDVEFIEFDKRSGLSGMRALRRGLEGRRFGVLMQMQVAARANLLSAFIPADRRIGYDRTRSKDLHGLFINERIPDRTGIHVLEAIGSFCEPLGLKQNEVVWNLPVPQAAREWARGAMAGRCAGAAGFALLQPRAAQLAPGPLCRRRRPCRAARLARGAVRRARRARAQHGQRDHRRGEIADARPDRQGHAGAVAGAAGTCGTGADARFRADAHRQRHGRQGAGPARRQQSQASGAPTPTSATA